MNGLYSSREGASNLRPVESIGLAETVPAWKGEAGEEQAAPCSLMEVNSTNPPHGGSDAKDGEEWTALMLATVKGQSLEIRALLDGGAEINARNSKGWSALRLAVSMNDSEVVQLLLESGADVNDKDHEGNTVLMQAAGERSMESINLLLEHGADTSLRNDSGETAATIAARQGYPEIVRLLNQGSANGELSHDTEADESGLFSEGELQQLIGKIEGLMPREGAADTSAVQALKLTAPAADSALDRLAVALAALRPAVPTSAPYLSVADIAHKLMLSLPEAATLSGLSRNHLREAIRNGELKSRKMGRGWRIKRADLESYVEGL